VVRKIYFKLENLKIRNFNIHAYNRMVQRGIKFKTLKSLTWYYVAPQKSLETGGWSKYTCIDQLERYVIVIDFVQPNVIDIITVFYHDKRE
jgi:hypothetical protein